MALLIISVCNERLQAMASINGTVFITVLSQSEQVISSTAVDIRADATFSRLSPGDYQVELYHPDVSPTSIRQSVTIEQAKDLVGMIFCYLEPERQFLSVRTYVR